MKHKQRNEQNTTYFNILLYFRSFIYSFVLLITRKNYIRTFNCIQKVEVLFYTLLRMICSTAAYNVSERFVLEQ